MFWGEQRSTSSSSRLCCSSFSVSVLNFATSPNSGVEFFLGFFRSEGLVPYAVHEPELPVNAYRLVIIPHSTCVVEMVPQTGTALQHARTLDRKLPDELKYCEKNSAGSKV